MGAVKQVIAAIAAIVFAGVALYYGRSVQPQSTKPQPQPSANNAESKPEVAPEQSVWALLDAATAGDVAKYADLLTGPFRDRFLKSARDNGVREGLEQSFFGVKGVALMAPQVTGGDTCVVEAEFQYADRKEGQRFHLRRTESRWLVERIERARPLEQAIPYGTPVDAPIVRPQ